MEYFDLENIPTYPENHNASVAPSGIFKAREGYMAIVNWSTDMKENSKSLVIHITSAQQS